MDLSSVLTMQAGEADSKARLYREIKMPSDEDRRILAIFTALAAGKQVVDYEVAIREAGLDERGLPRLAISETTFPWCYLLQRQHRDAATARFYHHARPGGRSRYFEVARMPKGTEVDAWDAFRSQVPIVPPECRVRGWKSMLVLWEVEEWAKVPRPPGDPILLKPLYGSLCTIEAEWDLTEVERMVLGQRPS